MITGTELRRLYREKWLRRLILLAWSPALILAARLYLTMVIGQAFGESEAPDEVYLMLFRAEAWFVAILLAAFGASMISRDRTNGSFVLYFTRPLNAAQYLLGKLTAVLVMVLGITLVPGVLLALAQLLMSPSADFAHFLTVVGKLTVCSLLVGCMVSNLILILSSLSRSTRFAGITWLALFVFLEIARNILTQALGSWPILDLISVHRLFIASAEYLLLGRSTGLPAVIAVALLNVFLIPALWVRISMLEREQT
jgi:ABC-type transport system involved in multi-copper enzyme maturation permease subunit